MGHDYKAFMRNSRSIKEVPNSQQKRKKNGCFNNERREMLIWV